MYRMMFSDAMIAMTEVTAHSARKLMDAELRYLNVAKRVSHRRRVASTNHGNSSTATSPSHSTSKRSPPRTQRTQSSVDHQSPSRPTVIKTSRMTVVSAFELISDASVPTNTCMHPSHG